MDEFLDGLDCKLRVSGMVADSIMMGIVNSTMEEAFEKACSKEGDLERLNEKSRFCELAVMQLEWCLKFVQEETDSYVVVESIYEREKLVSDLTETRDRIQRRLEETEFAILEKDRELIERFENESKLRQVLELKDRELRSLHSNLDFERTKIEGVQEFIYGNRVGGDDDRDGDFCELKNSVDQQFFNIKQKLEDERINLTNGMMRKMNPGTSNTLSFESDSQMVEKEGNCSSEEVELFGEDCDIKPPNTGFEKMGSDIDILKETLDLAFGMMGNAISLSEVGPMEQQWRWTIEKDTLAVVFRGFLRDIKKSYKANESEERKQGPLVLLGENWSEFMDEITSLRNELDLLVSQNEDRAKNVSGHDSEKPLSKTDGHKGIPKKVKSSSAIDHLMEPPKEDPSGQGSLVAEMIRNHESIIRQKSEELNWLKGEILRERGCSSLKKDKDNNSLKKRIQDVILRLDSVIEGNAKIIAPYNDSRCVHENDLVVADLSEEARQMNLEREESNLKSVIMEEVYVVLLENLVRELHLELDNCDTESLIRDEVCKAFFKEMVKGWNEDVESYNIENQIKEEIYHIVFGKAVKDAYCRPTLTEFLVESTKDEFLDDTPSSKKLVQNVEGLIGDDVRMVFLREMVKEWNDAVESYDIKNHICEEVRHIVFHGAVNKMDHCNNFISKEYQKANFLNDLPSSNNSIQNLEGLIRDDVCTIVLREKVMEWNTALENYRIESLLTEEIYRIVFTEVVKDIDVSTKITLTECQEAKNEDNFCVELESTDMLAQSLESLIREDVCTIFFDEMVKEWKKAIESNNIESLIREEMYQIIIGEAIKDINSRLMKFQEIKNQEYLFQSPRVSEKETSTQKLESLSDYFQVEEDLMSRESSELLMEQNGHTDLMHPRHEKSHNQIARTDVMVRDRENNLGLMERKEDVQIDQLGRVLTPFSDIPKSIVDFECVVRERIGLNISRLKEMNHKLDSSIEHVASLSKKELVYRKAFLRRCYDLQKAETEVDLLGDEVDGLLGLLKKIYLVLDHHSPILQNYFEVMDILKLIRKELNGEAACTPH